MTTVYGICSKFEASVKPIWMNKGCAASSTCDTESSVPVISLDQITNVMENLVKRVVPRLVEDTLSKNCNSDDAYSCS
jgi:hypothetical protein